MPIRTDVKSWSSVCTSCGKSGVVLYRGLKDLIYRNGGTFGILRCPGCGLLWLSPRPAPEEMARYYSDYYTHAVLPYVPSDPGRFMGTFRDLVRRAIISGYLSYDMGALPTGVRTLGRLLGKIFWLREMALNDMLVLPNFRPGGRLVEIGCGSGDFLSRAEALGWKVLGIEPDASAAVAASSRGLEVFNGTVETAGLPEGYADAVVMKDVIEHLYDPVSTLKECRRLLKPGGRLVIRTPNSESLGHRKFGAYWMPLDPPRHLWVFSAEALGRLVERAGFTLSELRSSPRRAISHYNASALIVRDGDLIGKTETPRQPGAGIFAAAEKLLCLLGFRAGEELTLTAVK